jgi:multidrug efflux pump
MKLLSAAETGDLNAIKGLTGGYIKFLNGALNRPLLVVLLCIGMLFGINIAYGKFGKGVEFFPNIEPDVVSVLVHSRGNYSVWEEKDLVAEVEERLLDIEGLDVVYSTAGGNIGQSNEEIANDVIGQIQLALKDWNKRPSAAAIEEEIRNKTGDIAGLQVEVREQQDGPQSGKDIQIELSSRHPEKLDGAVELVYQAMNEIGGFIEIEDSRPIPGIEWELKVDRTQASKFGVDLSSVGDYVRMVTNGLEISEYRPNDSDDEIDIVARHPVETRTLSQLDNVRIETANGSVPISSFVERIAVPATGVINRTDQRRTYMVKANLESGLNITQKITEIQSWAKDNVDRWDPEVSMAFKGDDENQRESGAFLVKALLIALFVMFTILLTQFNNFYHAFLILTAVVMSTIGVMIGLLITGQPFGIVMSGVGVIALAGIIVNNNIVLIDTFQQIQRDFPDMALKEVIIRTGAQRMRPVLLTTVTTVLGLLPMVLQVNIDFINRIVEFGAPSTQWWVQLSTAICFGLIFSTALTLVVTPCALLLPEKFGIMRDKFKRKD